MLPLQFITHCTARYSYLEGARLALEGGCRWIQLRMKDASEAELEDTARRVHDLCTQYEATFIIDDHVELTRKLKADGVHLGKHDMPIAEARSILGEAFIIGATANTLDDVIEHARNGADYIGCGPYRFTTTKQGLSPILGLEGYRAIIDGMRERGIDLPLVAIGGITYNDIPPLLEVGVQGIAMSGSILQADNPADEVRRLLALGQ